MEKILNIKKNWYSLLIDDLKNLACTKIVEIKHEIGKRILRDELYFNKPEYGGKRIENIAKDLKVNSGDIWRCVQFAKKYNELSPTERELSWNEIKKNHLPDKVKKKETKKIPLPKGKYNIIYADPPWNYYAGGYKNQSQHYDPMDLDQICLLPVEDLADENCLLFLWVTSPMLGEGFKVIESWGFEYSTMGFVWVKSNKSKDGFFFGLGNWTRANCEYCLIAKRGKIERQRADISQIIYEPVQEHSKKPDIVRNKIIDLVGDLPRIELFSRQVVDGWKGWGNEYGKN